MTVDEPTRMAAELSLPGVELYPLPDGKRIVSVFALIKTRDANGDTQWFSRTTHDYTRVEFPGALVAYTDNLRQSEASSWVNDDEGDIDT